MSNLYITQGIASRVIVATPGDFAINPERMRASRTSVAGNIIRQETTLHASTAETFFSGEIPAADATTLAAMHLTSGSVTLEYKNKKYDAVMIFKSYPSGGVKTAVSMSFSIVRQWQ